MIRGKQMFVCVQRIEIMTVHNLSMIREIKVSKMVVYSVLNDIKQGRCRIAMYIFILHTKEGMIKKSEA
jgi:hypothetical protein